MHFGFYGSLRDKEVLSSVAGQKVLTKFYDDVEVNGFKAVYVKDETYPVLIEDPRCKVSLSVYKSLDESEIAAIRAFEGDEYIEKTLSLDNGLKVQYFGYRDGCEWIHREWILEEFQDLYKAEFLRIYCT